VNQLVSVIASDVKMLAVCLIVLQYLIWSFLWLAWNAFIACLYLSIGTLTKVCNFLSLAFSIHKFRKNIEAFPCLFGYVWSPYVIRQTIIFSCCDLLFFLLFFISLPNLSGYRVDVYHTSTHGVALV